MNPTILSWSGGKDASLALFELQRGGVHDVRGLVTTVNRDDGRVGYHGVPRALVQAQADALGLPLQVVPLPAAATNAQYETAMREALSAQVMAGVRTFAFGDLFLEDIRRYRESLTAGIGLDPIFPIWGRDTGRLVDEFVAAGFRAVVVSVDLARLDASFAGRVLDASFVADLPAGVDPCGENGEFHSFVFDAPNFSTPLAVTPGRRTRRDGYCYCELV